MIILAILPLIGMLMDAIIRSYEQDATPSSNIIVLREKNPIWISKTNSLQPLRL